MKINIYRGSRILNQFHPATHPIFYGLSTGVATMKRQCMDPVSLYIDACQRESVYEMEACFNALVCDDDAIDLTDIMESEEEAERLGLMMQSLSDKNHFVLCRFFCMAEALGKRITYEDARAMNNACATIRRIARVAPLEKYNYILLGVWLLQFFGFEM